MSEQEPSKDQLEEHASELASQLASWRQLQEMPFWVHYSARLERQKLLRQNMLVAPLSGFGAVLAQEFMKGEVGGLNLAQNLPEMETAEIEAELARVRAQLERMNDAPQTEASPAQSRVVDPE